MNDVHEERGYPARHYKLDEEPKKMSGLMKKAIKTSNWNVVRCICGCDIATKGSRVKCPKCNKIVDVL